MLFGRPTSFGGFIGKEKEERDCTSDARRAKWGLTADSCADDSDDNMKPLPTFEAGRVHVVETVLSGQLTPYSTHLRRVGFLPRLTCLAYLVDVSLVPS